MASRMAAAPTSMQSIATMATLIGREACVFFIETGGRPRAAA